MEHCTYLSVFARCNSLVSDTLSTFIWLFKKNLFIILPLVVIKVFLTKHHGSMLERVCECIIIIKLVWINGNYRFDL